MWCISKKYGIFTVAVLISSYEFAKCNAISNNSFNASLRDYSVDDGNNITNVKTLQKEELGKHAYIVPAGKPIKFKEIPDSAHSTSNSRGLLFHDHPGYVLNDYEEGPHYEYGHDYHFQEPHPDLHSVPHNSHSYDHGHHGYPSDPHHYGGHHLDYGHYKHYKHALATKAVLWPLAGVALLGAAAALVSNPILLQLGVISGKRRRRDTEEITGPDFPTESIKIFKEKNDKLKNEDKIKFSNPVNTHFKRRILKADRVIIGNPHQMNFKRKNIKTNSVNNVKHMTETKRNRRSFIKSSADKTTVSPDRYTDDQDDDRFIPIAITLRSPKELPKS